MHAKIISVVALALVLASCNSPNATLPTKNTGLKSSFKVFEMLDRTSLLSTRVRVQDGQPVQCPGGGTISGTVTENALSFTTSANGCTADGATVTTGSSGFTMVVVGSVTETAAEVALGFDGAITTQVGSEPPASVQFSEFVLGLSAVKNNGKWSGTASGDGTLSVGGTTFTFDRNVDTVSLADLEQ